MTHPLNQFTADGLRAQAITSGWRQTYNEALWDWLTASGYTQNNLSDKMAAAVAAGFDFSTFAASWTPSALFASSEVGVWYDPSDLSTVWADNGTTPATVNGLVYRVDDKSGNGINVIQATEGSRPTLRGTPIGENLVSDPNLYTSTDWTAGADWVIAAPTATATLSSGTLTNALAAVASKVYLIEYTLIRTAGSVVVSFGGASGTSRALSGRYYDYVTASDTSALVFTGTGFTGSISAVSVYDVSAGNVGAPYFLEGSGKALIAASVSFTAYPVTIAHRVRNLATGGSPIGLGLYASNVNYKIINTRAGAIDRNESTFSANFPYAANPLYKDEVQIGEFSESFVTQYNCGVAGTPVANTNTWTTQTNLGVMSGAGLTMTGQWYGGVVIDRVITETERRNLTEYLAGNTSIQCWGDSITDGTGAGTTDGYPEILGRKLNRTVAEQGVSGESSTQILTRFEADTTDRDRWINTWWSGINDSYPINGWDPIKAALTSFVSGLSGDKKYLILGAVMASTDSHASALDELDAYMAATYGNRFVDIRAYLQSKNDGSVDDLADVAAGLVPRSLRSDTAHLNALGYHHVADCLAAKIVSLGW